MGRAFTDAERSAVQEKLRRTGLKLFAEKGIRGVSIRDLTAAAGIAQGGFYSFYQDKSDFLTDLIAFRVREKLALLRLKTPESLQNPLEFLSNVFYSEGMHLKDNQIFNNIVSDTLIFFCDRETEIQDRVSQLYRDYLKELATYWSDNGYTVLLDTDGLMNLIRAAAILFSNASLLDASCFETIYRQFCDTEVPLFVKVTPR